MKTEIFTPNYESSRPSRYTTLPDDSDSRSSNNGTFSIGSAVSEASSSPTSLFGLTPGMRRHSEPQGASESRAGDASVRTAQSTALNLFSALGGALQPGCSHCPHTIVDVEPVDQEPVAGATIRSCATRDSANEPSGMESHRFVNQIDYVEHQIEKCGLNLEGATRLILSAITDKGEAPPSDEFKRLAEKQLTVLKENGVETPGDLCALLRKARKLDLITAGFHGLASGAGFNGASAFINFMGNDIIASWIGMDETSTPEERTAQSAIAGLLLSAASVMLGPATEKTFRDAYYMRPPGDELPSWVREAQASNMLTTEQLGHLMGTTFLKTYGGRNLLRLVSSGLAAAAGASPELVGKIDNYLDPIGGCFAGIGFKMLRDGQDEARGVGGIPYFLARNDLKECLIALNSTGVEKAGNMCVRALKHVSNSIKMMPRGILNNFLSLEGIASHATMTLGFAGVSASTSLASAVSAGNLIAREAGKYASMGALYYGYGRVMAGAEKYDAKCKSSFQSETNEANDIAMDDLSERPVSGSWQRSSAIPDTSGQSSPQSETNEANDIAMDDLSERPVRGSWQRSSAIPDTSHWA